MPITQTADELFPELARYQRQLLAGGGIGLLISLVELLFNPTQFYQSYLMAYMFCLSISLGSLALGMVHQLTGGAWGIVIRRPIGAASRLLPLMTLLFVPVVVGMNNLYPWTHAAVVARDELLQAKRAYLNVPFFLLRAAIYFSAWNAISYWLNRWAVEQDRTADPEVARKMQKVSAAGLVLYGLTITFASFDWLMSLEPHWYSTIYGVLVMGGQGLSAMAFLIGVLVWLSRRPPLDRIIVKAHFHDLGNLLLAFVMLWAYFGFSQYLIIWAGNLPQEISWYAHRLQTGWRFIGIALILFHFAVPFVLLLSRTMKREATLIVKVAIGILVVRLVDLFWLIAPEFHTGGIAVSWVDIVLPASLGAVWLGCFISQLRRRAILPVHDPEFEEALGHVALT
jgi:hypothetical protein